MCTINTYTLTRAGLAGSFTGTLQQAVAAAARLQRGPATPPDGRVDVSLGTALLGSVAAAGPCERLRKHCLAAALDDDADHQRIKVFAAHLRDCARALRAEASQQ